MPPTPLPQAQRSRLHRHSFDAHCIYLAPIVVYLAFNTKASTRPPFGHVFKFGKNGKITYYPASTISTGWRKWLQDPR